MFPQGSVGICGICAFASAFAYFFNQSLGAQIYAKRDEYLKALQTPITSKSKKSEALKFWVQMFIQTSSRNYIKFVGLDN